MRLVFRAFNHAAAQAVNSVVKDGVLTFGNRALRLGKVDMQTAVLPNGHAYLLVRLAIAEFCRAFKFFGLRFGRNPIKA